MASGTIEARRAHSAGRLAGARVAIVLKWPNLGGAERQALLLARHLVEVEGARVEVQALTDADGTAAALFRESGIDWRSRRTRWRGSRPRTLARLVRIAAVLRESRPDVLLPYCEVPNVVCGLVWRFAGATTCVWSQRDVLPFTLDEGLVRRAIRSTPILVSNSSHGAEYLVSQWSAQRDRIHVVPNGVALPPAMAGRAVWRARLRVHEGDIVVCSLAHFGDRKDLESLLMAWHVALAHLDVGGSTGVLVLAGRPEHRGDALEELARELRIESRVCFLGDVDDVAGLLSASDAGVLSSPTEGCPNAVLEYMAAGLAIVGTDVPGIREALGDSGAEYLVPVGDVGALGAALAEVSLDQELRSRLGVRNRERQRACFGIDRMLQDTVKLIAGGLAGVERTHESLSVD